MDLHVRRKEVSGISAGKVGVGRVDVESTFDMDSVQLMEQRTAFGTVVMPADNSKIYTRDQARSVQVGSMGLYSFLMSTPSRRCACKTGWSPSVALM